jgi:hypothetical protein
MTVSCINTTPLHSPTGTARGTLPFGFFSNIESSPLYKKLVQDGVIKPKSLAGAYSGIFGFPRDGTTRRKSFTICLSQHMEILRNAT